MGKIKRYISEDGSVIMTVADATSVVYRAEQIHKTSAVVSAALGRLLIASSLMGSMLKNEDSSITLRMSGQGPCGSVIAVSDFKGNPRGYVQNPVVELELNQYGKLDVSGAIGKNGYLYVIKDLGFGEPYVGQIPIVSGEVAEDIASYYANSEQTPTVCALGVLVDTDLTIKCAGGYLIQLLPGASDEVITALENNINNILPVTEMLNKGMSLDDIANVALKGFNPQLLDETAIEYRCNCSKKRVEQALISVGKEELQKIADEEESTQVECHFCDKKYVFTNEEIKNLIRKSESDR